MLGNNNGHGRLWLGWCGYLLCLVLPANGTGGVGQFYGWELAVFSSYFWYDFGSHRFDLAVLAPYLLSAAVGNLLLLTSPFLLQLADRQVTKACGRWLLTAGLIAASYIYVLKNWYLGELTGSGYFIWVAAHFVVGSGLIAWSKQEGVGKPVALVPARGEVQRTSGGGRDGS